MAPIFCVFLVLMMMICSSRGGADGPPPPGYYPSSTVAPQGFDQSLQNLWGPQHQKVDQLGSLTIWLDNTTGSGFKSKHPYVSGYFGAAVKLQPGYTAGVITSFYLSNNQDFPGNHDEIDLEFLGTTPDKPYTLQTNVYNRGSGDGAVMIGREIRFHLWFDPTKDFHNYAIFWSPNDIIFLVDDVPIRWYPRKNETTAYPSRAMWVYGSIWDASDWATEGGKYRADYKYQPFISNYTNFKIGGCTAGAPAACRPTPASSISSGGLSQQQQSAMDWVRKNCLVYDYCQDSTKNHTLTPEC